MSCKNSPGGDVETSADFSKASPTVKFSFSDLARLKLRFVWRNLFDRAASSIGAALVLLFFLGNCQRNAVADGAGTNIYSVKGVVKELPSDGKSVVIRHEKIPGYMDAMVMPFEVKDTNILRGIQPGDAVSFQLAVTPKEGWIQSLVRLNTTNTTNWSYTTNSSSITLTHALEPLVPGDPLPEYTLTNELGQAVNLAKLKGEVIAFTFFFTSCPYPDFCPKMTLQFGEAERALEAATNAPAHWHLYSISFDPKRDTPAHLADYGTSVNYNSAHWSFLTGSPEQIGGLADQMGENYWTEDGSIGHNLRTVVVAPNGRIRNIVGGNKWTVDEFVADIIAAAKPQ